MDWDKLLPSSLEYLRIGSCDGLLEVVNLPSSLREIRIRGCSKLRFISGQVDALQTTVHIRPAGCSQKRRNYGLPRVAVTRIIMHHRSLSLASLPSGPEAHEYSSLRRLVIRECPGIKSLPSALQQQLDSSLVHTTDLDSRLQGTHQSFPYGVWACWVRLIPTKFSSF